MTERDAEAAVASRIRFEYPRRVDEILRLNDQASLDRAPELVLKSLCQGIAKIADADIVSVYLREQEEGQDILVMQANVGFPEIAVGKVRLRMGEGITGFAAECQKPMSVALASDDEHYKYVPDLGEEQFPVFLALPLLAQGRSIGVLVLQRRESRPFVDDEIPLLAALTMPVLYAIERAYLRKRPRASSWPMEARSVRLQAHGLVGGQALGSLESKPSFVGIVDDPEAPATLATLSEAIDSVLRDLSRGLRQLSSLEEGFGLPPSEALGLLLNDQRFRQQIHEECARLGVLKGLREMARNYALTPLRMGTQDQGTQEWMTARAVEVEDLCLLIAVRASGRPFPTAGCVVLLPDRLTSVMALAAVARRAAGILVADRVEGAETARKILRLAQVPVLTEVSNLSEWARIGDRLWIDGDGGYVRVNPSPGDIARVRHRS